MSPTYYTEKVVFVFLCLWARASPEYVLKGRLTRFLALIDVVPYLCPYNHSSRWYHESHLIGFIYLLANKTLCWSLNRALKLMNDIMIQHHVLLASKYIKHLAFCPWLAALLKRYINYISHLFTYLLNKHWWKHSWVLKNEMCKLLEFKS